MNRTVAVGVLICTTVLVLRAAGQDDPKRRAEEEQRRALEAQRQPLEAKRQALEAEQRAKAQEVQRAIQTEITKAMNDLAVLRAKSAELEMTIRKLQDQLAQEERRRKARAEETALREQEEKAREKALESLKALDKTIVRFGEDPGRGMEEKLDTILKKLESIERRLTDLERKRQPNRRKK
jgi:hypothetical protein